MPLAGLEPTIAATEQPHTSDHKATAIGSCIHVPYKKQ